MHPWKTHAILNLSLVLAAIVQFSCVSHVRPAATASEPLTVAFLLGDSPLDGPLDTSVFTPPTDHVSPGDRIEGILRLVAGQSYSQIEVLVDHFEIAGSGQWKLTQLPPFQYQFVSDGHTLLPMLQTPQRSDHPYWEIILQVGRIWKDPADEGWSRAAMPFALKEKNQNCTFNGLMSFVYKADGSMSRVAWQISSETCLYLKINLWGVMGASYQAAVIEGANLAITERDALVARRLPVKSILTLGRDHPVVRQAAFTPPGVEDVSVYGFVLDGVHYRSDCFTRFGAYPFCDELVLPSYSLAKSLVAGLHYLLVTRNYPEFSDTRLIDLVPECKLPDRRWNDVSMQHLLNMTTGNFDSTEFGAAEHALKLQEFFLAESHAGKIRFSCEAWPRKAEPGTEAVYHSTDDYLLGTAMNAFLRRNQGQDADFYRDLLYPELFQPLGLSPLLEWTQRSYDDAAQPFTAFGLILHSDDLARLATFLNSIDSDQELFDQSGFNAAMFRDPGDIRIWSAARGEAYRNGFWGLNLSQQIGCAKETWVPFMSGYGGILVALIPNGSVYYYFSDSDHYRIREAVVESNKIQNLCRE